MGQITLNKNAKTLWKNKENGTPHDSYKKYDVV